ncbi:TPA_exp: putative C6 finger domain protein [Trichophyton benhamiae CBS 112371]|nr:TPA_exp: putative C6 finger domain protein [Trichophyton benhamiae CBS 112371]
MRGIRATLQTLDCESPVSGIAPSPVTDPGIDDHSILPEARVKTPGIATPCNHTMGPIIASTSEEAYSKLQKRLDYALYHCNDADGTLAACAAAFDILKDIRSNVLSSRYSSKPSPSSFSPLDDVSQDLFEPQSMSLPQVASWLRSFANRSVAPQPTEPLTRYFLTFLVQVPQAYLDLVLPLLDKRLESPVDAELYDTSTGLTMEQALALDIYAHWSVLMFLVEEESWWIGNLPFVTLSGMVNRFGDNFVTRLWPEEEKGRWWPGGMLNILREIKRYR